MKFQILITLVLVSSLIGCNLSKQSAPPIKVSAAQLIADYKENPLAANKKYEGHILIIDGVVSNYTAIRGTVGIYLEHPNPASEGRILCLVDKSSQPDIYSKLSRSKNVIIAGTAKYQKDNTFIMITDCEIK